MAKKKKYSLSDRVNYYSSIVGKGFKDNPSGKNRTPKQIFASGYVHAVERGEPSNIDERESSYKKGVAAGLKAKEKSRKIKF